MWLNICSEMKHLRACPGCGQWPDLSYEFVGARWCAPCVPWSRVPCPFGPQIDFGASVLARLEREGLRAAHGDAARLVAWLEAAAKAWPGRDPWRTLRLAVRAQGHLEKLAWWHPAGPLRGAMPHAWPARVSMGALVRPLSALRRPAEPK